MWATYEIHEGSGAHAPCQEGPAIGNTSGKQPSLAEDVEIASERMIDYIRKKLLTQDHQEMVSEYLLKLQLVLHEDLPNQMNASWPSTAEVAEGPGTV